ncbi:hypothetical protein CHARACLAT_006959 [Characodon lateralis]|uniref:Uncharacterized protein n=1 Tax=Characodon lateralis TaxID=208331 RepID=A0ABU7CNI6_9TELE|nr:hypothetical protein [Characodon lateralis]
MICACCSPIHWIASSLLPVELRGEALTYMIKSCPRHDKVLNKLGFCKDVNIPAPPLLAVSPHPNNLLCSIGSQISLKRNNKEFHSPFIRAFPTQHPLSQ